MIGICCYCKEEFKKREQKYKFCSILCSNRYNLNGLNNVVLPLFNSNLAEFIGICLGDGYVSKYQVSITLNSIADELYIPFVVELSKSLFKGATISVMLNKYENSVRIRVNSRIAADYLYNMGIVANAKIIPSWILNTNEYKQACIRGLIDTEGSISYKQYKNKKGEIRLYKQLNFRNIDKQLLTLVRDYLIFLGLQPTVTLNKYVYLSNDDAIRMYREKIGFSNPKLLRRSLVTSLDEYERLTLADRSSSIDI